MDVLSLARIHTIFAIVKKSITERRVPLNVHDGASLCTYSLHSTYTVHYVPRVDYLATSQSCIRYALCLGQLLGRSYSVLSCGSKFQTSKIIS